MISSDIFSHSKLLMILAVLLAVSSCKKDDFEDLEPATFPAIGEVFIDDFSPGLQFDSYDPAQGANVGAFAVVSDVTYAGDAAMRFAIPDPDDPDGSFAGGTFTVPGGRDLTEFDALIFWMRASKNAVVDLIGFGDEFEFGESKYIASLSNISVNSNWKQYILPLPDPSVLTQEQGMFWISEGTSNDGGLGYTLWIDEVEFVTLGTLAQYRPAIQNGQDDAVTAETGQRVTVQGLTQTVNLPSGVDQVVNAAPGYFEFSSSNSSVATVNNLGEVMVLDAGTAEITAKLAGTDASGSLTVEGTGEPVLPPEPAPVPTRNADSVIALWSNVYDERPVDTWNARYQFSTAEEEFIQIAGDDVIRYRFLNFVGIEFKNPTIDVSGMTHFHINIWTPDETAGAEFKVLLTDAGPDGMLGTGDDVNDELTFTAPLLQTEEWVTIEIPLADFTGLTSRTNLVQMVLSGTLPNVFVDNVYFYIGQEDPAIPPTSGPPAPTQDPADVISIYSDAYTDVPNLGYNLYGAAAFEEVNLAGDNALKYTLTADPGGNFQVLELGEPNRIDAAAAGMTNFRFDLWFPKAGVENDQFLLKLVDFGSDPPPTASITINSVSSPAIEQGTWLQFDFTLAELAALGMTTAADVQQVVFDLLSSGEVYVDNIYFYTTGGGGGDIPPTTGPPVPTQDAGDVISIYSDAYTNVPNLGFNLYGAAAFEEVNLAGDNALRYTFTEDPGGNFQVIELGEPNRIDAEAAGMTNFRFDLYFPKEGVENEQFLLKLVDASDFAMPANVTINSAVSDPAIAQGTWLQFDYTISELESLGLAGYGAIQQVVIDLLSSGEVYVDNIYFYTTGGGDVCDPPMDPSLTAFPIDFENCEDLSGVFESGDGVTGFPTGNPDMSGINTSDKVYQFNKVVGAAWYSGIFHIFPSNFDMTTTKVFRMKIWSPKPDIIVRFQIEKEGSGGTIVTYQKTQMVTTTDTWVELTFDFNDQPFITGTDVYDKIVIIPDDMDNGPADGSVYYIDDITLTN